MDISKKNIVIVSAAVVGLLLIAVFVMAYALVSKNTATRGTNKGTMSPSVSPTPSPVKNSTLKPDKNPNDAGRTFKTYEEAREYAAKLAQPETLDQTRISALKTIYTPTSKQWEFTVLTRLNPIQKDDYVDPTYEYRNIVITIQDTGIFSKMVTPYNHVNSDLAQFPKLWKKSPELKNFEINEYFEMAKTHIESNGKVAGEISTLDYHNCFFVDSCDLDIDVTFVNKGEEKKNEKEATTVTFKDKNFYEMTDGTLQLKSSY